MGGNAMGPVEAASERYRFAVLGPVRAWRGDAEVDPGSPQQCAVLSMLLSRRGRYISLDDILNGLWNEQVPSAARPTARTYISRLRRALSGGSGGMTIKTGHGGYALELTNSSVDFLEFEALVESARTTRASGDLTGALEQLQRGLALWFGGALAGVPGDAVARTHQARAAAGGGVGGAPRAETGARQACRGGGRAARGDCRQRAERTAPGAAHARPVPLWPAGRGARGIPQGPDPAAPRARDRAR